MVHQKNLSRRSNCFTVNRYGDLVEGIIMTEDLEKKNFLGWEPYISAGLSRMHKDRYEGCEVVDVGAAKVVYLAQVRERTITSGRVVHTLKEPKYGVCSELILKINLGLPYAKSYLVVGGRQLKLFNGVAGGQLLERDGTEVVLKLLPGETVTCFFVDGAVRVFSYNNTTLVEHVITAEKMLELRIGEANRCIEETLSLPVTDLTQKRVFGILMGMADLLSFTTHFDGQGNAQAMRLSIVVDFFLNIHADLLAVVYRRVAGILHKIDPPLVSQLNFQSVSPSAEVISLDSERSKRERAKRDSARAARSEHDRNVRAAMKGRAGQTSHSAHGAKKSKK